MFRLAVVVIVSAILIAFAKELNALFKKIVAIRGMKLLFPLTLASLFMVINEKNTGWFLFQLKAGLHAVITWFMQYLPFSLGAEFLVVVIGFTILALAPIFLIELYNQYKKYHILSFGGIMGLFIWLFMVMIWLV